MSVRLFICLVFIAEIVASEYQTASQYKDSTKNSISNQKNTRILVTDSLNDSPSGGVQTINITETKTNVTVNKITVIPLITEQDKNGTVTKKPDADKDGMETQSSQIVNSYPPYSSYEVTENVIDVPDDRTPGGPIVPNYTHYPPILNLARPANKTTTNKPTEANTINKKDTKNKEEILKTKKNHVSIFHFNAEFEDKMHEAQENKVVGLFKGIKNYIHSFQKGIVDGLHKLFHKHHDESDHGDRLKRAIDNEESHVKSDGVQNVDKTEYNVHRRRISTT